MAAGGSRKTVLAAMFANAGIAIAKFVAFLFTSSSSMLAESIHSVADTSNQGLLLLGGKRAEKDFTDTHAFGYGRERYFWSFVVAQVLFLLGGLFALFEGYEKVAHPHEITSPAWAVSVLCLGLVLEGFAFRTAIQAANRVRGDRGWWEYIRRSRSPEIPIVLLEDLGALTGLLVALGAVLLASTVDPIWDGIGTMTIGALLTLIAVVLIFEMKSLLIGESGIPSDVRTIQETIREDDRVTEVLHLRTQHIGPEDLLVAGKIQTRGGLTFEEVAETIDRIEVRIRDRVPEATMIYLEPGTELASHEINKPDAG